MARRMRRWPASEIGDLGHLTCCIYCDLEADVKPATSNRRVVIAARTDRLFATPTLLTGAAQVLDLEGSFEEYNVSRSAEEADALALAADWMVTLDDFAAAYHQMRRQTSVAAGD